MVGKPQWPEATVAEVRRLFEAGYSAQAIANQLDLSRGAVCGKLHRLGLTRGMQERAAQAPAPERRKANPQRLRDNKPKPPPGAPLPDKPKSVLPPLRETPRHANPHGSGKGSGKAKPKQQKPHFQMGNRLTAPKDAKPAKKFKPHAPLPDHAPVAFLALKEQHCRWAVGDRVDGHHRFCGAKREPGKPYCDHHCALAYQPQPQANRKSA